MSMEIILILYSNEMWLVDYLLLFVILWFFSLLIWYILLSYKNQNTYTNRTMLNYAHIIKYSTLAN
jgi:hypothetical protein